MTQRTGDFTAHFDSLDPHERIPLTMLLSDPGMVSMLLKHKDMLGKKLLELDVSSDDKEVLARYRETRNLYDFFIGTLTLAGKVAKDVAQRA